VPPPVAKRPRCSGLQLIAFTAAQCWPNRATGSFPFCPTCQIISLLSLPPDARVVSSWGLHLSPQTSYLCALYLYSKSDWALMSLTRIVLSLLPDATKDPLHRRLQFDVSDHEESLRFSNVARPRFKQLLQVFRYWDGYPFNSKTQMLPGFLDLNQPATRHWKCLHSKCKLIIQEQQQAH
jgi:hypothetical protein